MKKHLLGITVALTFAGSAFAAAKPEQIPADAKGVVLIQSKAFLASPFFKALETKQPSVAKGLEAGKADFINPKAIKEVTIFFSEKWGAAFIEMPYQNDDFIKKAMEKSVNGCVKKTIAGKTVLIDTTDGEAIALTNPNEFLFLFVRGEKRVAEVEKTVTRLLDSKTPRLAATAPLAAVLTAKPGRHLYGAVTDVSKMIAGSTDLKQQMVNVPGIENVQRIVISLSDADQGRIRLTTKLVADTAENGTQIQEGLLGMKAMLGMAATQMPALTPLVKKFTVKQSAAVTDASITIGVNDIEALMCLGFESTTTISPSTEK